MESGKPSVIVFDVNETLLDMTPVKKKINSLLGSKRAFRIWFGLLLQYSLVDNCTDQYDDFTTIASATMDMAAKALKTDVEEKEKQEALTLMTQLPDHPDVEAALQMLKKAGYRLATLTNSPISTLTAQLEHACLTGYFEANLSVDAVQKYKPSIEPYRYAIETLGVAPNEAVMVAAHGWDIAGAVHAGMKTAFIERKGQSVYPLAMTPNYIGKDLVEVAEAIMSKH